MEVTGEFETHLTVRAEDGEALSRLRREAARRGMKFSHITLAEGSTPSQPMLTYHSSGTLREYLESARKLAGELLAAGMEPLRIKIETCPDNPAAPKSNAAAELLPPAWHFEHHVKLCLSNCGERERAAQIATRHHAHLSHNALRHLTDGTEERFLTQRHYGTGRPRAKAALNAMRTELLEAGLTILEVEAEYVVCDTNAGLDAGWLNQP